MEFASNFTYVNADASDNIIEVDEGALHNDLLSNISENKSEDEDDSGSDNDASPPAAAAAAPNAAPPKKSGGFFSSIASVFSSSAYNSANNPNNPNEEDKKKKKKIRQDRAPKRSAPIPPPTGAAGSSSMSAPLPPSFAGRRFQEKADTNVVALKFGTLIKEAEQVWTGDVIYCKGIGCKAALSDTAKILSYQEAIEEKKNHQQKKEEKNDNNHSDKMQIEDKPGVTSPPIAAAAAASSSSASNNNNNNNSSSIIPDNLSESDRIWICEFCNHCNILDVADEEIPKTSSRDYVLENPSGVAADGKNEGKVNQEKTAEGMVIFVIDTSGSMCVTTQVPGKFSLKGFEKRQSDSGFNIPLSADERAAPVNRAQNVTYVSRLQCVQASIQHQIDNFMKMYPNKRVGLITFSNDVMIYGEGIDKEVEIVTGDKLKKQDILLEIGKKWSIEKSIKDSGKKLIDLVFGLEEHGQTALGPALVVATGMASKAPGSNIVICTDGLSNIGVGSLDGTDKDDNKRLEAALWYDGIGNVAKASGTTVSVISIKGADSALEELSKVAEATGGAVDKVDPLTLKDQFSSILSNPVIATQVSATFLLHSGLKFRNELDIINNHLIKRDLGNVTEDTEITFEYEIDLTKKSLFESLTSFPFQLQIHYTKLNGMKMVRVLSKAQPITFNRQAAENNAKLEILAANVSRTSAKMAERGDYDGARARHAAWGKFMKKNARNEEQQSTFSNWVSQVASFDRSLAQQSEKMNVIKNKSPAIDRSAVNSAAPPTAAPSSAAPPFASTAISASSALASPDYSFARQARADEDYSEIAKFKVKSSKAFK